MDFILHFLFYAVVEIVLCNIGRATIRIISFGAIRLDKPTHLQAFGMAIVGLVVLVAMVFIIALLVAQ